MIAAALLLLEKTAFRKTVRVDATCAQKQMHPYFLKSLKTRSLSCLHVSGKMLYFLIV